MTNDSTWAALVVFDAPPEPSTSRKGAQRGCWQNAGTRSPAGAATGCYLAEIRDRIDEIISTGTPQEHKTMCEAFLAELHIDGDAATPVMSVPLSRDDIPLSSDQRNGQAAQKRFAYVHQ